MDSIAQKLEKLYQSKLAIKNSLINKGLDVDDNLEDYSAAIDSLSIGAPIFSNTDDLNNSTNKQEGTIAIVYDSSSTPTVFKCVDNNVDLYYIDEQLWSIPELTRVIKECDVNNYGHYFLYISNADTEVTPKVAFNYRFIALYNDKTWFYREASNKYQRIANGNTEDIKIYFAEYSLSGNALGVVSTLPLAGASENAPSYYDTGLYATLPTDNTKTGNYLNSVCYSDKNKTSVYYESSTFSKVEADLEYTQIS